jgi:hypothetical protein
MTLQHASEDKSCPNWFLNSNQNIPCIHKHSLIILTFKLVVSAFLTPTHLPLKEKKTRKKKLSSGNVAIILGSKT